MPLTCSKDALLKFEGRLLERDLHARTIHVYLTDTAQFLTWLGVDGEFPAESITVETARAYQDYLQAPALDRPAGYAPGTIARKIKSLRYFYDFLVDP